MKAGRGRLRPEISLTADDARELRSLSVDLERELLRSYETFLICDQRRVDERRWRLVRSVEGLRCYRGCSSSKRHAAPVEQPRVSLPDDRPFLEIGPQAAMAANWTMPMFMSTGKIEGSLDDALYGLSFHDTESLRTRRIYTRDDTDNAAVLGVVEGPTHDDPFQFLGVVWFNRVFPSYGFVQSRDTLLVAAIHKTRLSNGEEVAVVLYHSIEHQDAPERRDLSVVRADFSYAMLLRQVDEKHVELYFTSFVDMKGSTPEAFAVQDIARFLLSVATVGEIGFRRKLVQRMRETQRHSKCEPSVRLNDDSCAVCHRKASGLFKPSALACQICKQRVCSKCYLTKEIAIESSRASRTTRPFNFCLVCTLETRRAPAADAVRKELFDRDQVPHRQYMSSFSFSSTSSDEC